MKISKLLFYTALMVVATTMTVSCEDVDNSKTNDSLKVKFINSNESTYTITTLQVRNRGSVDQQLTPTAPWSANVLKNGERIAPGEHIIFTLDLPEGQWAEYRLGVDNGSGEEVMLYDQPDYDGFTNLPITHSGINERTVSVTITYKSSNQTIIVSGWLDIAGIDK